MTTPATISVVALMNTPLPAYASLALPAYERSDRYEALQRAMRALPRLARHEAERDALQAEADALRALASNR